MLQNIPFYPQKFLYAIISALILTCGYVTFALADSPGALDLTFHGTGIVTTSISNDNDIGDTIAVQADGKIVVAGTTRGAVNTFAVVRYDQNGSLDPGLNGTGIVTTSVGQSLDNQSVALQPDQKIVLVGNSFDATSSRIVVVRYNPNGSLDTNFNLTGIVTTAIEKFNSANAVAVTNDKIVVVGHISNGSGGPLAVVRYNDDGSLDSTFNGSGVVTTPIGAISGGEAIAVQPDGKLIVAGETGNGLPNDNDFDIAVARYNPDGSLDSDFNGTGIVTTTITNGKELPYGVALQPDGKIVVVGETPVEGEGAILIVRYTVTGTLDTTLNGTGIVTTPIGQGSAASGVVIQANNKIVIGGVAHENGMAKLAIVRYNSDGSLDTTFKNTGIVTTSISQDTDVGRDIAIQSDGKLLVAGFSYDGIVSSNIAVARYLGDPITDPDGTAPDTQIDTHPTNPSPSPGATFTFSSPDDATFQCQLDGSGYTGCASPKSYTGLTDGSHTFEVHAKDASDKLDATPASYTWTIDTTPPIAASSLRADPNPTRAASVRFTVTFTEPVTGVDVADFSLTTTGTLSGAVISGVTGLGRVYTVTVSPGKGEGTLRLDVVDNDSIVDATSNPLGGAGAGNGAFTSGEAYLIFLYHRYFPLIQRN